MNIVLRGCKMSFKLDAN